jgi:hypothetical protein
MNTSYVGLDVHAESITAAILEGDNQHADVVSLQGDLMKVRQLFRQRTSPCLLRG